MNKTKFKKGQVVSVTITGKIYSVNKEGDHIFYGVEWDNALKLKVKTLHDEHAIKS